jgi:tetratricopeptide (TPR) repeat protein
VLKALALAEVEAGQQNEAIATYSELIALYDDNGDDEDLLDALDSVSTLLVKNGSAQAAILHANRGIELAQRLGDDDAQMHIGQTLGDARQELGESGAADMAYTQALSIARQGGDTQNEAIILYKLGFAQLDNGDAEGAGATWEQALALFRAQEKTDYEGKVLGGLGTAYGDQGRWQEAVRFHTSALYTARQVGNKVDEAEHLTNLAYASVQAEDLGQAVLRYRQALHLAYEGDDKSQIVSNIVELAGLLSRSPAHLSIAKLLIDEATLFEPNDRDVISLRERIRQGLADAGGQQKPVSGTVYEYAANAYQLLEN